MMGIGTAINVVAVLVGGGIGTLVDAKLPEAMRHTATGSSTEYADGHLEEVNERGIILRVEGHGEHPAQPLFYPWGAVIQLSEERDG